MILDVKLLKLWSKDILPEDLKNPIYVAVLKCF